MPEQIGGGTIARTNLADETPIVRAALVAVININRATTHRVILKRICASADRNGSAADRDRETKVVIIDTICRNQFLQQTPVAEPTQIPRVNVSTTRMCRRSQGSVVRRTDNENVAVDRKNPEYIAIGSVR